MGVMALRFGLSILLTISLSISNVISVRELSQTKDFRNYYPYEGVVKTIETEHGDIYDCVDFYKQPGFSHPALENHNFHPDMTPANRPNNRNPISFGLKDKACPYGSVPIRKMKENGLNRTRVNSRLEQGTHVAISRSMYPETYYGVSANITLHNPAIGRDAYSSGQISIKNGIESLQVGWTANPLYYHGDLTTRLFIYTDANGQSCYNTDCPGFILVRSDLPLDIILAPLSEPRGPNKYVHFVIFQEPQFKNWWLGIGKDATVIGFWPQRIFKDMAESAMYVECGGEAWHDPYQPGYPPMGHDFIPNKHEAWNAYCYDYRIVRDDFKAYRIEDTETYTDHPHMYGVADRVYWHGSIFHLKYEHVVIYGGTQVFPD